MVYLEKKKLWYFWKLSYFVLGFIKKEISERFLKCFTRKLWLSFFVFLPIHIFFCFQRVAYYTLSTLKKNVHQFKICSFKLFFVNIVSFFQSFAKIWSLIPIKKVVDVDFNHLSKYTSSSSFNFWCHKDNYHINIVLFLIVCPTKKN